ncbi:sensor histidine kinase [Paenibacillus thalictri]|uniref:histidine kinase n=1 Tax=Paenibacillus thalictri TaxID=2527873 RepID=A0A4Q9DVN6_9BACL|nr:histidine kinase [Paenibacillus thalictri]TBL81114.1 HAMP domain-containing protein [Paenibacillus thalictri]
MNTIRQKMIWLSLSTWIVMAGVWLLLSIYNQQTVEAYNTILQRYIFMNEISQLSANSVTVINRFMDEHQEHQFEAYSKLRQQLLEAEAGLGSLTNPNNEVALVNYGNMIGSQIEAMELTVASMRMSDREAAQVHFDEATNISKYIAEATLSLLSTELKTYNTFYESIIQRSRDLQKMGFWLLGMASCILLLFSYRIAGGITKPILSLSVAARKIAMGNYNDPIDIKTNDEISFLAKMFNQMRLNIQHSIQEIQYNAQLENDLQEHKLRLKENELKSLQSQINPHFLFNTLNILAKKAYLEGAEETSDLISSVSGLLRYNLKRLDSPVTLRDELRILDEYLTIQKARFAERVQISKDIDESCLDILIPNLTLQPFVENAFIHAIEPSVSGGHIAIRTYRHKRNVVVEIADDGGGMDAEQLDAILRGLGPATGHGHSTGIGIGNVIHRLDLFYGIPDIVSIRSVPGEGTCVMLTFPEKEGDSDADQSDDR